MVFIRVFTAGVLCAAAGCAPSAEQPFAPSDPQDQARSSTPTQETADGERTRLQPHKESLPDDVLADRLEGAHVAFIGEVISLTHHDVTLPDLGAVPHTFVTFRVDAPVKGAVPGEQVTLRFVGGPADDGVRRLHVSHIPEFEVGERDLLFVRDDNGRNACPLVDCGGGQLMVEGDRIKSSTGHILVTLDDGRTRFVEPLEPSAPRPELEQEGVRPERAPVGTPLTRDTLVRRLRRPGPAAATISVSPAHPYR